MIITPAGKVLKTFEYRNGFTRAQTLVVKRRKRSSKRRYRRSEKEENGEERSGR
jgi:hypothetical protein